MTKTKFSLRNLTTIAAFAFMGAAAGAAPAFADITGEALSVHVKYGDLDLTSTSGVNELYNRIKSASTKVCEPFSGRDLADVQRYKVCFTTAMSHAVMDTQQYALIALYSEKTGKMLPQLRLAQLDAR